ncbi:MAG TPA: hypothetical protein VFK86_06060 [Bauldia sp.]|nr:hypothetical protein [Bauldia sp.]
MRTPVWPRAAIGLAALLATPFVAVAGEIAEKATLAESLLGRGYDAAALSAFDKATEAFWMASPLQLRVIAFADSVEGYGNYAPRPDATFRKGDTLRLYFEPVGFAYRPEGDGVRGAIAVDVEIRTPGGLILGSAEDFVRLEWRGKTAMHEVHATVATPLPDLKPGGYLLLLTLRDEGSAKTEEVTLPFTVAE